MGKLQGRNEISDGEYAGHVGAALLVGQHIAAIHGNANFFISKVLRDGTATYGDEEQICCDFLAVFQRDCHVIGADLVTGVLHTEFKVDATLTESAF
ncbi:unannotated protein [freshwater metagenome]|uniref:Unannotated protein n=1 Tax=freshwater metagenome TaxID=449393 RepID=A0A6J6QVW8_9ZZZZ